MTHEDLHDVVIIGGGNAGISTAARLVRKGVRDVVVVEPQTVHTYRPLLSYVGSGQASRAGAERTQRQVIPDGVTWIRDSVVAVEPDTSTVRCSSGDTLRYRDLVVATGLVPDDDELPGIARAVEDPAVASNYLDRAEETWARTTALRSGHSAVFTVPRPPVSCTGTTLKPVFLAADHWRRTGLADSIDITVVVDRDTLVGVPELDARLADALRSYGVRTLYRTSVTGLHPDSRTIAIAGPNGTDEIRYDMLHLVPPFRGPTWLEQSGLTGDSPHGLVDIDQQTFRHRSHPDVWALGDGADAGTDPSGGALRKQSAILVDNLLAARSGRPFTHYDGYTVAPVAVSRRSLIAAEFDRDAAIQSSLPSPLNPLKPRASALLFDRFALPLMYWNLILTGRG